MHKQSDINDILAKAKGAGSSISNWYGGLNPNVKRTMMEGIIGAGTGAAITGGLAALSRKDDPEHGPNVRNQALMGALMGGVAGVGLPTGLRMLTGGKGFSGEDRKPALSRLGNSAVGGILSHPVMTAAPIAAATSGKNREAAGALIDKVLETIRSTRPRTYTVNAAKQSVPGVVSRVTKSVQHAPGARIAHAVRDFSRKPFKGSKMRLAAIPAAMGAGWLADKYLKGDY